MRTDAAFNRHYGAGVRGGGKKHTFTPGERAPMATSSSQLLPDVASVPSDMHGGPGALRFARAVRGPF